MIKDIEYQLQQRPKAAQKDEAGGKSIPIDKIYDALDYFFGWDNWDVVVNKWERSFDKIDVSVSLIVNFGDHTVRKDGTATIVTKSPNKESDRTDVSDMDLPRAVAYATKNAAAKYGRRLGRALNKGGPEKHTQQPTNDNGDIPNKKDKVSGAIRELTAKIIDVKKNKELSDAQTDKGN